MTEPTPRPKQPLVSVIMAVKNSERFLKKALDSVRDQTYPVVEVIVIDGHSTDGTEEIARSYDFVRYMIQVNEGFEDAWNQGIDEARGEFIAFLDSDDYWTPSKLQLQVDHLAKHPEHGCVIGHLMFFVDPGQNPPPGFNRELLARKQIGYMPGTVLVRPEVFQRIGKFDSSWKIASDIDWFARIKDAPIQVGVLPDIVLHKRVHQTNLSYAAAKTPVIRKEVLQLLRQSIHRQSLKDE